MAPQNAPGPTGHPFDSIAEWVSLWITLAQDLKRAADLLRPRVDEGFQRLFGAFMANTTTGEAAGDEAVEGHTLARLSNIEAMLSGMALENLLKACVIHRGHPAASQGKLDQALRTHELAALATLAGLTVSPEEQEILTRLTALIKWAGRYTVGTSLADHAPLDPTGSLRTPGWSPSNRAPLDALFARLSALLPPGVWPTGQA